MFSEWLEDEQITLSANQTYWYGPPQIDQIVWKVIPDSRVRFQALQEGSIHAALEMDPEILSAAEDHPDYIVIPTKYPPPMIVSNAALGAITRIKGFDVYSETEIID
jgi:ABC-type transport system substrate-binding protein